MDFPPTTPDATPTIRCKPKHRALKTTSAGAVRGKQDVGSKCPGWLTPQLQARLLDTAIEDPDAGPDAYDRPRKLWNALGGWVFVGVSSNESGPAYNCYPSVPATALADELKVRAERRVEEFQGDGDEA